MLLLEYYAWDLIEAGGLLIVPVDGNKIPHYVKLRTEDKSCDDSCGALLNPVPQRRKYLAYVAPERDADGNPVFATPIDTDAAFSQQDKVVLQRSDYLACGLRFLRRPLTLSKGECAALASAVDAYWRLGGARARVPEMYEPKMIGPAVGPTIGYFGQGECNDEVSDFRVPFQHQSNALTHTRTRHSNVLEALWNIMAEGVISLVALAPLSVVYGALHCAAWDYHFPTTAEKFLWRFTCIVLVALILFPFFWYMNLMEELKVEVNPSVKVRKAFENIGAGCLVLGLTVFRAFIVIESFISLRALPVGTFLMPEWLQMIPHL